MTKAEEILREKIGEDCIWEDMGNLTNTPIRLVLEAMEEYAQSKIDVLHGVSVTSKQLRAMKEYLEEKLIVGNYEDIQNVIEDCLDAQALERVAYFLNRRNSR